MLVSETKTLKNGMKLRFAEKGKGHPLVFLHGYPENLQIWTNLVNDLSSEYRCLALDWPGMGESDEWLGGAAPKHMAQRLFVILDELGFDKVALVACDMGGQAALEFALDFPDRTSHLIVMNSLVFGSLETSWEIRLLRKYNWNRHFLSHLPRLIFYRALATFLSRKHKVSNVVISDFWNSFKRPVVRKFISKMCAGYQGSLPGLEKRYSDIKLPTLVLWGARDKHFPLVQGQKLNQEIKSSRLVVVEDGEHWMNWSHSVEIADEIKKFISLGGN